MLADKQILQAYKAVKGLGQREIESLEKSLWDAYTRLAIAYPRQDIDTKAFDKVAFEAKQFRRALQRAQRVIQNIQPFSTSGMQNHWNIIVSQINRDIPRMVDEHIRLRGKVLAEYQLAKNLAFNMNALAYSLKNLRLGIRQGRKSIKLATTTVKDIQSFTFPFVDASENLQRLQNKLGAMFQQGGGDWGELQIPKPQLDKWFVDVQKIINLFDRNTRRFKGVSPQNTDTTIANRINGDVSAIRSAFQAIKQLLRLGVKSFGQRWTRDFNERVDMIVQFRKSLTVHLSRLKAR